jgi:hypothetical protein
LRCLYYCYTPPQRLSPYYTKFLEHTTGYIPAVYYLLYALNVASLVGHC